MNLVPQVMFQGQMSHALDLWRRAFPEMTVTPPASDAGRPTLAQVVIAGQELTVFDSPPVHEFGFTPAISLTVTCDTGEEVDRLFDVLSDGGEVLMPLEAYDFSPRYAWINDRFGVSWQLMQAPS